MKKSYSSSLSLIVALMTTSLGQANGLNLFKGRHDRRIERQEAALTKLSEAIASVEAPIKPLTQDPNFQLSDTADHRSLGSLLDKEELQQFLSWSSEDIDASHTLTLIEKDERDTTHFTQIIPMGINGKIEGYCDFLKSEVLQGSDVDLALRSGEIQFGIMSEFQISSKGDRKLEQKLAEDPEFKTSFEETKETVYKEFTKVNGASFLRRFAEGIFRKKSEKEELKSDAEVALVSGILNSFNQATVLAPPLGKETPEQLGKRYKASRKACFPKEVPFGLVSL